MNTLIIYSLLGLTTGVVAIGAYFFFRGRGVGKREEFDATRDLFI